MVVYSAIHNIHVKCFFYVLSLPAFVARRLLLVGWVWVGFEGVSSCCRAVSGTFFASVWKNTAVQKLNVEKVTTVPGRIASAEQNVHHFKSCRDIKIKRSIRPFPTFPRQNSFFFGRMITTAPSTAFQGGATLCRSVTLNVSFDITFAIH